MGSKNWKLFVALSFVAAIVLFIGCFTLPIGYYTFLRIVVFVVAVVSLLVELKDECVYGVVVNGLVAILFNPIIPIYLHNKVAWMVLDSVAAAWFVVQGVKMFKLRNKE